MTVTKKEGASLKTKGVSLEVEIDTSGLLDKLVAALSGFFTQEAIDDLAEDAQEIKEYMDCCPACGFNMNGQDTNICPDCGCDLAKVTDIMASPSQYPAPVVKSLIEEQQKALFVVLSPNEVDLHGDIYDEYEVELACENFNTHCRKANLFHQQETKLASPVQSFISMTDLMVGDKTIKKGTWLQWWYFPKDSPESSVLWEAVKKGEITGVSIGCHASVEML